MTVPAKVHKFYGMTAGNDPVICYAITFKGVLIAIADDATVAENCRHDALKLYHRLNGRE